MKFLKYFVLVMLSLMATVLTLAWFKAPEYKVERSIVIHAPRAIVWNQISNWKQFNNWNPWYALDSSARYQFAGTDGATGSSVSWKGNAEIGTGSLRTWRQETMKSVDAELEFVEPWQNKADITLTMDGPDGQVEVSWIMRGRQTLIERSFFLFMGGMESKIGPDFEGGLEALKQVCERGKAANNEQGQGQSAPVANELGVPIYERTLPARRYVGIRNVVTAAQLADGNFMQQSVLNLMAAIAGSRMSVKGSVFVFHYMNDVTSGMMDVAVCIPVDADKEIKSPGVQVFNLPERRVLIAEQQGWLSAESAARRALRDYVAKKKIQTESFTLEELLFDPLNLEDPAAIKTRQYVLIP
jgi:hypothetical protein